MRPGEIGIVLNYKKIGSKAPWITRVSPGLLTAWNEAPTDPWVEFLERQDNPEQSVGVHDRVTEVNGKQGSPDELMLFIKESKDGARTSSEAKLRSPMWSQNHGRKT